MSKTTILIVEDEAIVAADLAAKLRQLGYEVAGITAQGEEAVALAGRLRPQLVLMDIRLEGALDGIEAAQAIHRRHDVPVIYLTAHSDAATLARAKLTGPFGYILKPFEERELATQIELGLYKHQIEQQLRQQREWLRVTLTSIGDAVIATDVAGRISFVNPVAESLTGWKAEEAIGRPVPCVFRIVNEHTGQPLEEPVARVLREGRDAALANHAALVTRDGRSVPVEDSAAPILDAAGQVIGAVLVFRDVTAKRRSEEALRASEEKFRIAFADAAIGFAMTTPDGRFVDANPAYCALTGYQVEELRTLGFPQLVHPDDVAENMRLIDGMFAGRINDFVIENRYLRKDGGVVWVRKSVSLVRDAEGAPQWIIALVEDVTERKQSQERLRQRTAVLEGINRIFQKALACHAEEKLGDLCLTVVQEVTSSRFGFIGELSGDGRLSDIAISDPGWSGCRTAKPVGHRIASPGFTVHGIFERALSDGKGFYVNNSASDPDGIEVPDGHPPMQAVLGVPLIHAGKTVGMVGVADRAGGYRDADLEALEMLAPAIIQALLSNRAEEALCQAKETSEALNRINQALHSTLEFDEVMQRIVAEGSALLGSESATVSLRRGDGWVVSHVHRISSSLVGTRMEDSQERHAALALKSRRPVAVDDAFNDDRFNREHLRRHNIRSVLVAPLNVRDEGLGVIFFNYHTARHKFTAAEVNFSLQMATIAGVALENAQLFEARKVAEEEVRKINRELEQRVKNRTAEIEAQYKELEELNAIIRQLSRKTIEAMESDRRALSKEIHDSIAGTLAAIKMQLEAWLSPAALGCLPADLMPLEKIVAHLTEAIKETRSISRQLRTRTLDDFGLEPALVEHIQHFRQFYPGIEVVSQIEMAGQDIPADIQTVLYRVVQEALNNVGRHSAATVVRLKLTKHHNQICLTVADNGCGFNLRRVLSGEQSLMGYGIHSMRERVEICKGKFQLRSGPKKGTVICISIPV